MTFKIWCATAYLSFTVACSCLFLFFIDEQLRTNRVAHTRKYLRLIIIHQTKKEGGRRDSKFRYVNFTSDKKSNQTASPSTFLFYYMFLLNLHFKYLCFSVACRRDCVQLQQKKGVKYFLGVFCGFEKITF